MKIRIIRYMLRNGGITYKKGDTADIPEKLAKALLKDYPEEFAPVIEAVPEAKEAVADVADEADKPEDIAAALEAADKPKAKNEHIQRTA